jgi:hypothetical protein
MQNCTVKNETFYHLVKTELANIFSYSTQRLLRNT